MLFKTYICTFIHIHVVDFYVILIAFLQHNKKHLRLSLRGLFLLFKNNFDKKIILPPSSGCSVVQIRVFVTVSPTDTLSCAGLKFRL